MFALGVTLIQVLTRPFIDQNDPIYSNPKWLFWLNESFKDKKIKYLLSAMVHKDSQLRPSIEQVLEIFNGDEYPKIHEHEKKKEVIFLERDMFSSEHILIKKLQ